MYSGIGFDYIEFWNWVRVKSKNHIVLVSEYNAPDDFQCIWKKEHKTTLDKNDNSKIRVEKLFIHKNQKIQF